jgi:hypothetical protein
MSQRENCCTVFKLSINRFHFDPPSNSIFCINGCLLIFSSREMSVEGPLLSQQLSGYQTSFIYHLRSERVNRSSVTKNCYPHHYAHMLVESLIDLSDSDCDASADRYVAVGCQER